MVKWESLINRNPNVVREFALGNLSASAFQSAFSGKTNPARLAVRNYGTTYARRLSRKALRRRGLIN